MIERMHSSNNNISCLICHVQHSPPSSNNYTKLTPFLTNCCNRWICESCLKRNPNFLNRCIFCQKVERISSGNRHLGRVEGGEADIDVDALVNDENSIPPPSYADSLDPNNVSQPPKYEEIKDDAVAASKKALGNDMIIHYVRKEDTLVGLSFKYGVEIKDIRKANFFFDDNIFARRFLKIPKYTGSSLSEKLSLEDELKTLIKRFQLKSKCVEYDEAKYYMEQSDYDIESAIKLYRDDILWEMQHPRSSNNTSKKKANKDRNDNNKLKVQ